MTASMLRRATCAGLVVTACLGAVPASAQRKGTEKGEWRYGGADEGSSRYSPLDQINAENGPTPDFIYRAPPIKVGDRLYMVAGQRRTAVAIDPATGETIWTWRERENPRWEASTARITEKASPTQRSRGIPPSSLITPGYYLVALDAETGPFFGLGGIVDLHLGMGNYPVDADRGILSSGDITASSAAIVVNGVVVVGNSPS